MEEKDIKKRAANLVQKQFTELENEVQSILQSHDKNFDAIKNKSIFDHLERMAKDNVKLSIMIQRKIGKIGSLEAVKLILEIDNL